MPKSTCNNILIKTCGVILILMGTTLLFIKIIRRYLIFMEPYSFELFLMSPILIILGLNILCKNIKIKFISIGTRLLFGIAIIYLVILSASWFSINAM